MLEYYHWHWKGVFECIFIKLLHVVDMLSSHTTEAEWVFIEHLSEQVT